MSRRASTPRQQQPLEHRLLLTATLCLLAGGAVMVYSASYARSVLPTHGPGGGDGTSYLIKYIEFSAVGLILMQLLSRYRLEHIKKLTPMLVIGSLIALLLVLVPGVGVKVNGAYRWLGRGPFTFQPSEFVKLTLVMHAAAVIAVRPRIARELRLLLGPVLGVAGIAVLFLVAQPDIGTALVICLTLAALLVAAGIPLRQLAFLAGCGAFLVLILTLIEPYRLARLTSFLHPANDPSGAGFQSIQGRIAIGSGGLFGVGPGQSVQKIFYLPEAHTDFILAVIGEELGLIGVTVLMFLYGMIAYAGLRTAKAAKGVYAKLLAAGLTSLILCQASLNTFAVLGLAPLTGVPLPFVSSGSSSLITMLASMGLLLNIARGGSAHLQALPRTRRKPGRETYAARAGTAAGTNDRDRSGRDSRPRRARTRRSRGA